jgi:hypothetical protein
MKYICKHCNLRLTADNITKLVNHLMIHNLIVKPTDALREFKTE